MDDGCSEARSAGLLVGSMPSTMAKVQSAGKVAPTMVLLVEGSLIQRFGEATSAITPANVKSGPVTIGTTA